MTYRQICDCETDPFTISGKRGNTFLRHKETRKCLILLHFRDLMDEYNKKMQTGVVQPPPQSLYSSFYTDLEFSRLL